METNEVEPVLRVLGYMSYMFVLVFLLQLAIKSCNLFNPSVWGFSAVCSDSPKVPT